MIVRLRAGGGLLTNLSLALVPTGPGPLLRSQLVFGTAARHHRSPAPSSVGPIRRGIIGVTVFAEPFRHSPYRSLRPQPNASRELNLR